MRCCGNGHDVWLMIDWCRIKPAFCSAAHKRLLISGQELFSHVMQLVSCYHTEHIKKHISCKRCWNLDTVNRYGWEDEGEWRWGNQDLTIKYHHTIKQGKSRTWRSKLNHRWCADLTKSTATLTQQQNHDFSSSRHQNQEYWSKLIHKTKQLCPQHRIREPWHITVDGDAKGREW